MVTNFVKESAAALDAGTVPDWISDHLRAYRESGGQAGHFWDATAVGGQGTQTCLLLTTVGRKSGKTHTHPLLYVKDGDDYVIVGSKGGSAAHPGWYFNLLAHPEVELQVGPDVFKARATLATGSGRARLWQLITRIFPPYDDYQTRTSREIPLFSLERIE